MGRNIFHLSGGENRLCRGIHHGAGYLVMDEPVIQPGCFLYPGSEAQYLRFTGRRKTIIVSGIGSTITARARGSFHLYYRRKGGKRLLRSGV